MYLPRGGNVLINDILCQRCPKGENEPNTFAIATLKGSKGSIELPEDATVGDLYAKVKPVVGWTDEEDDFYVIILSGKKLTDLTVKIADYKPNPTKAQVVATKVKTAVKKNDGKTPVVSAPVTTTAPAESKPEVTMSDDASPTAAATAAVATTTTTTTTPPQSTTPATTTTTTTTTTPDAATTTAATTTTPAPEAVKTDTTTNNNKYTPFDWSKLQGIDGVALMSPKYFDSFIETVDALNQPLATELKKDPTRVLAAMEILTRQHHTDGKLTNGKDLCAEFDADLAYVKATGASQTVANNQPNPAQKQAIQQQQQQQQAQARAARQQQLQAQLTDEDKKNIEALMELGFSKAKCTEAYLLCDKNNELAANYLFGQM